MIDATDVNIVDDLNKLFHAVVNCAKAKSHIRSAARVILLRDFDKSFPNPNPNPPRNRPIKTKEAYVEAEPKHGYNPVPGAFGSRKY
jgi:hypothetical protein